jgi:hypothetical protein
MSEESKSEEQVGCQVGEDIWDGGEVFGRMILSVEEVLARKLGNCERMRKWEGTEFYGGAREEWFGAWKGFISAHGWGPVLNFRADLVKGRVKLGMMEELALLMLRWSKGLEEQEETLRNMAEVVRVAARAGDVEFFKSLALALRDGDRRVEARAPFLGYNILGYWFSGLLWLMEDKAGWAALSAYTDKAIERDAYRQACHRLGLKGYKGRFPRAPVLGFDAVSGLYRYAG